MRCSLGGGSKRWGHAPAPEPPVPSPGFVPSLAVPAAFPYRALPGLCWVGFGGLRGSPGVSPTDVSLEQPWGAWSWAGGSGGGAEGVAATAAALPLRAHAHLVTNAINLLEWGNGILQGA